MSVGKSDDHVINDGGRVVNFQIGKYSKLIGCELAEIKHKNKNLTDLFFGGVTWITVSDTTSRKLSITR